MFQKSVTDKCIKYCCSAKAGACYMNWTILRLYRATFFFFLIPPLFFPLLMLSTICCPSPAVCSLACFHRGQHEVQDKSPGLGGGEWRVWRGLMEQELTRCRTETSFRQRCWRQDVLEPDLTLLSASRTAPFLRWYQRRLTIILFGKRRIKNRETMHGRAQNDTEEIKNHNSSSSVPRSNFPRGDNSCTPRARTTFEAEVLGGHSKWICHSELIVSPVAPRSSFRRQGRETRDGVSCSPIGGATDRILQRWSINPTVHQRGWTLSSKLRTQRNEISDSTALRPAASIIFQRVDDDFTAIGTLGQ